MPVRAQFLAEVPEYHWCPENECFRADVYIIHPDGSREFSECYHIRPEIYRKMITAMIEAQQAFYQWSERPDNVVVMQKK